MSYNHAIDYLFGLQKHGIKLGLDNITRLLSFLGNPQDSFKALHIAGTNGKGSTSAMLASILRAAGFNVGLFTSPHLVSFTERIRVNNAEISEQEVIDLTDEIKGILDGRRQTAEQNAEFKSRTPDSRLSPTFFEFVTAMAFLHFRRKGVEWAVVETGMGGRLDATNVIVPEVSVITSISCDHKEFLGRTLKEIAEEKAGIIKNGVPVVASHQDREALKIINSRAADKNAGLFEYDRDFASDLREAGIRGITFDYKGRVCLENLFVPLCGLHQMENASVAIKTIELIMEKESVSAGSVRKGLADTEWPGRLELIKMPGRKYDILIDGAHNPSAARKLAGALKNYFIPVYGKIIIIFGIMSDKDMEGIMSPLMPVASEVIVTAPDYGRAASPERLAEIAISLGSAPVTANSVKEALDIAAERAGIFYEHAPCLVLITGSFYTIGEAKTVLGHKGTLARLRE